MSEIKLSKDADVLICLIYKHYLELHDNGISKSDAKILGSSEDINNNIISEWSFADVDDTCRELDRIGFLSIFYSDNVCSEIILTDDAIIYMENRFHNKLEKLLSYISLIKP